MEQKETYVGTKTIKAVPMNITDAEKVLGKSITPAKAEYSGDGYLVEYEDGYQSWSPKEVFEKAYKKAETFFDRMFIEAKELSDRLQKLSAAIASEAFEKKVGYTQYKLMLEQQAGMALYYQSLMSRIDDIVEKDSEKG